ncbi:hypothetical protein [Rhizorhapis sp.]|uniref:hypothetical protein n=1 Tax=Rhizorhapis sp. TaxID=1968842 RepID=UPI002B461567|nr:hypothetical protein [Rhizorhapis sp.]HKR17713.1 hypothetical protein [Rhizorhapis sp.]
MSEMESTEALTEGAEEIEGALSPEEQARTLGWKPQDEFKGNTEEWVDADTFLAAREENLAIAKRDNRRLTRETAELNRKLGNAQKVIETLKGFEQKAYERALNDLKSQQKQAVRDGDEEAHDRISKELDELRDSISDTKAEKKQVDQVEYRKVFGEWLADNDWYAKDEVKRTYADSVIADLGPLEEYTGSTEEWLGEIAKRTSERFAKKEKAEPKVNPVGGANGMRQPGAKGKSYTDMPADAKQMADMMVRQGIFKDKDAYAKEYWKNV